jgi:ABC-type multidrug transport system fused ATPase/permease subunit
MGFLTGGLEAEDYDRSYRDGELIRRIAVYFRPHRSTVALVVAMVALGSLAATATPLLIARGIDALAADPQPSQLIALAAVVTLLGVLIWSFNYVRQKYAARAVGDVVLALREDAFHAVLRRDRSFFDQHATGRIVSRVTSDTQDFATVVTLSIELFSQIALVLVVSVLMFFINWQLAMITVAVGPIVVGVALGFRWLARRAMRQSQRATAEVNAVVQETISGIAVAKNFRREAALYEDFQSTNAMAYRIHLQRVAVFGSIFPLLNTLSGLATTAVVYAGGLLVFYQSVSLGDWYLFVQSLALFFYPVTAIASFWSQFQQGLAASERVFALIDAEPVVTQTGRRDVGRLQGDICFKDVTFSYENRAPRGRDEKMARRGEEESLSPPLPLSPSPALPRGAAVLRDFNLTILAGERLAVVGHTGAGKSSLIKLLLRFYEFQGGKLLVDGHDIRALDVGVYRQQIGYVPQQPLLFSGTVAENIRYGRPAASEAEVLAAARNLGDGSWVDDLPEGIASDVGERGARLSLGQRQLVALARVLLQNPAILLLDEATASIDPFTEAQIQAGLDVALEGRTSIVIAHRLSTVVSADRIIVMRQGQIVEQGNHDELIAQGGHYAELYATYFRHQALDYTPWEEEKTP